jgi:hypothetical protein
MNRQKPNGFAIAAVLLLVVIFVVTLVRPCYTSQSSAGGAANGGYTALALGVAGIGAVGAMVASLLSSYNKNNDGSMGISADIEEGTLSIKVAESISSPQTTYVPFQIKIVANDNGFNGTVYLNSDLGAVEPNKVNLTDGKWTGNITLYEMGANNSINLRWNDGDQKQSGTSTSNIFDTVDQSNSTTAAKLQGVVADSNDAPISDATVLLFSNNIQISATTTDAEGRYIFSNAPAGVFRLEIAKDNHQNTSQKIKLAASRAVTATTNLYNVCSETPGSVPVLLVPGIMGSYSKIKSYFWPYPRLSPEPPLWDSGELALLDPFLVVGWEKLTKALQKEGYVKGCTLFTVPYDWSLSVPVIRDKYLIPWIKKAKQASGSNTVDIIAHSMGGLVTRSYIQSDLYENDVRKFAMLGTPNKGSDSVYYIWEGGDPLTLDTISEDTQIFSPTAYFYTNTLNYFYYDRHWNQACKFSGLRSYEPLYCDKNKIYETAHSKARSSGQLIPVYEDALIRADGGQSLPIEKEENTLLKALNNQKCFNPNGCIDEHGKLYSFQAPESIFTKEIGTDKVETMLFIGTDKKTIASIAVTPPNYTDKFYKDGIPQKVNKTIDGDGTVLKKNVLFNDLFPKDKGLNYIEKSAEHGCLMSSFVKEILNFIKPTSSLSNEEKDLLSLATPTTTLVININGRIQLNLSTIANTKTTKEETETIIKNVKREHGIDSSSLVLEKPVNGKYTISLTSPYKESYELSIAYYNKDTKNLLTKKYLGFFDSTSLQQFALTVDNDKKENPIELDDPCFKIPTDLNIINENNKVRLAWQDDGGDAIRYEIYWRKDNQPYMQYLDSTTDQSYITNHNWQSATTDGYVYAVRAVLKNSGDSTFLSQPTFFIHEANKISNPTL